ncbi:hypothetical protein LMG28614_00877 [Paraburkholderia ultramafica]|uniref:Uncharacterized protein n=1 Tax=Paraburkholderia ultramafica TaxID=1544867 RepID=A0A6S7B4Z8_9BURK|nr:hypothetical protein [Paraburkholderia ultramafica]CAB3779586.1 hypothetical protein LMG28614_00877 [Paraburkholderia ultramafica]
MSAKSTTVTKLDPTNDASPARPVKLGRAAMIGPRENIFDWCINWANNRHPGYYGMGYTATA